MKRYSVWVNCQVRGEAAGGGGGGRRGGEPEVNCPVKRGKQYILGVNCQEVGGGGGNPWTKCPVGSTGEGELSG